MSYQNASFTFSQADIDAVKAAIATINSKLPFLVVLDALERETLVKLGPKSADFVYASSAVMAAFPEIVPASFNKSEYRKATALFNTLGEIKSQLDSLCENIDCTYRTIGNDVLNTSLEIYAYMQTAAHRTP